MFSIETIAKKLQKKIESVILNTWIALKSLLFGFLV